ncbi:hypothetical protein TNCV_563601 [Trichonephila clavipes]|nr:hypothetical protein TNCV_563601 [Trichonephila clavipes]
MVLEYVLSYRSLSRNVGEMDSRKSLEPFTYTRAFGDGLCNLNHGQVMRMTPELVPPLLTTTSHQRKNFCALDRFNRHHSPTRWVFTGTGLELVTCQPRSDTLTTMLPQPPCVCVRERHR